MKKAILLLLVTTITISGALVSCESSGSVSQVKATTDNSGMARIKVDGHSITVCTIDETYLGKTVPGINVSAAEQGGVGLIYADDNNNNYFPQLIILNHGLSETKAIYLPLVPVGDTKWVMSEPVGFDIIPDELTEVASGKHSELGSLLDREFPDLRIVVFMYDEGISDIKQSPVSIYKSPFPEVAYVYCHEGKGVAGYGTVPEAYMSGLEKVMSAVSPRVHAQVPVPVIVLGVVFILYITFQDEIDEALGFPKGPTNWQLIQQQQQTIQQQQKTIEDLQHRVTALEHSGQGQGQSSSQGTGQPSPQSTGQPQTPSQPTPPAPLNVDLGGSTVKNPVNEGHEGIGGGSGGYGGGGGCNDGCGR